MPPFFPPQILSSSTMPDVNAAACWKVVRCAVLPKSIHDSQFEVAAECVNVVVECQ
jgi:hypothetical protein